MSGAAGEGDRGRGGARAARATQQALAGILTAEQKAKLLERGGRRGGGERGPGFGRGREIKQFTCTE
jgi:hypothetical protein